MKNFLNLQMVFFGCLTLFCSQSRGVEKQEELMMMEWKPLPVKSGMPANGAYDRFWINGRFVLYPKHFPDRESRPNPIVSGLIFNPQTGHVDPIPPCEINHGTPIANQKSLLVIGSDKSGSSFEVAIYDFERHRWDIQKATPSVAFRWDYFVGSNAKSVFIYGGTEPRFLDNPHADETVLRYDIHEKSWENLGAPPLQVTPEGLAASDRWIVATQRSMDGSRATAIKDLNLCFYDLSHPGWEGFPYPDFFHSRQTPLIHFSGQHVVLFGGFREKKRLKTAFLPEIPHVFMPRRWVFESAYDGVRFDMATKSWVNVATCPAPKEKFVQDSNPLLYADNDHKLAANESCLLLLWSKLKGAIYDIAGNRWVSVEFSGIPSQVPLKNFHLIWADDRFLLWNGTDAYSATFSKK